MTNPYKTQATYPTLRINPWFDSTDCPMSAIEYVGFSPNKIINVVTKDDSIYENSPSFFTIERLDGAVTFPLTHYTYTDSPKGNLDYLVTDYTTLGQTQVPLFYQYELMYDSQIIETAGAISVYKNNESLLPPDSYLLQYSYDLINDSGRYSPTTWGLLDPSKTIHRVRVLLPLSAGGPDFYSVQYNKNLLNAVSSQRELIEVLPIYTAHDFSVKATGVVVSGLISDYTTSIFLTKDPRKRLTVAGIDPPVIPHDNLTSWFLRLNPGSFLITSGEFADTGKHFYCVSNSYNQPQMPIENVNPSLISDNVIKVDQAPIYIDNSLYVYPWYTISGYNPLLISLTDAPGSIGILVNGQSVPDLKITSIDRNNGYIQLNQSLNPTDNITVNHYVDSSGYLIVDNLELNPKISGVTLAYYISGYMHGLGIGIPSYNNSDPNSQLLYIYDPSVDEVNRFGYSIPHRASAVPSVASGWVAGNFISLCELNINRLSKDVVKITDARRVGGGIVNRDDLKAFAGQNKNLDMNELDWYSSVGFYGGDPLAIGSTIVIHIPSGVLFGMKDNWIASMSGVTADPTEAYDKGTKAFNAYLDQVIKRYISAGTNYALIPVNSDGSFGQILDLSF